MHLESYGHQLELNLGLGSTSYAWKLNKIYKVVSISKQYDVVWMPNNGEGMKTNFRYGERDLFFSDNL